MPRPTAPAPRPREGPGPGRRTSSRVGGPAAAAPIRLQAGDRGSALAELALILPFLAVLIFGCVDIGRAFALKNRLTNMAREGAIKAQYAPTNISTACSPSITTSALAEDPNVPRARVQVYDADAGTQFTTTSCGGLPPTAPRIRVDVSAPLVLYTPFVGAFTGTEIWVRGTATVARQV